MVVFASVGAAWLRRDGAAAAEGGAVALGLMVLVARVILEVSKSPWYRPFLQDDWSGSMCFLNLS